MNVLPTLLTGGTESQVMTLGRSLDPDDFALEFACLRRWGPFVQELSERGIPLSEYPIPTFLSINALSQQAKFARHIARRRIHIVHSYSFYGNVFAVPPARLAAAPVVIASIRDRGAYLTPLQKRVQRHVCRLADCVLVNADAVKEWLMADGYDPEKIVVIRNGVDLSRFGRPTVPGWLHRDLGVPSGTPLVAVVSRLSRQKGIEPFLEAAAILAKERPQVWFLIVGEPSILQREYLTELQDLAHRLGVADRVIFTGLRSDVPDLLASVTVSVMPSLNEALPNALLESMAAGAPVVATRVGGTPEALVDGDSGLLVPPADVPALAAAIRRLLDDPALARRVGSAACRKVANQFSLERMVAATQQLYSDLLTRKARLDQRPLPGRQTGRAASV